MANRPFRRRTASREADWMLRDLGREVRVARILSGRTQRDVSSTIGRHPSHVSRVEHGLLRGWSIPEMAEHAEAVGLKPWVRLFPVVAQPLDARQLALLEEFRRRIGQAWRVELEVPMPRSGDLRAADAVISIDGCRCVVEVVTRLADLQAQARAGRLKVRDLGADRLLLVVAATPTNRRVARSALPAVRDAFPIDGSLAMQHLQAGTDPGGDALIMLEVGDRPRPRPRLRG